MQIVLGPAPSTATVKARNNTISSGILFCEQGTYDNYQWGFESKLSQAEQGSCSGDSFCAYSGGIDTVNFRYWVKVGDDVACLTKSYFNAPGNWVGIHATASMPQVVLYPNPVLDMLMIESSSAIRSVLVYDVLGQLVYKHPGAGDLSCILDMSGLVKGVYFISLETETGVVRRKIVKE